VSSCTNSSPSIDLRLIEWMTARGWRLLPIQPRTKRPLSDHAVHDASSDLTVIAEWLRRWPSMNIAVACGAPGPQVLDIDSLDQVPPAVLRAARSAPRVRSSRTGHAYFAGTEQGTVVLDYGELRGRGSYALVPPSIHPTGRRYEWTSMPRGPLPPVPGALLRAGRGAGHGDHTPPPRPIIAGEGRHLYLKDFAVRLLRGGITDSGTIEAHLRCEFERSCEPVPAPASGAFRALAEWAASSEIAERERALHQLAQEQTALGERWWVKV